MIVKAINYLGKKIEDDEDFLLTADVFIGPEEEIYYYEVYRVYIISIKRLCRDFRDDDSDEVMLNRGWMITKYLNEKAIKAKLESIVHSCERLSNGTAEDTFRLIGSYLDHPE